MNKITFSKNSWHYKLVKSFSAFGQVPQDLCRYFRTLFFSSLLILIASVIVLITGGSLIIALINDIKWVFNHNLNLSKPINGFWFIGNTLWSIIISGIFFMEILPNIKTYLYNKHKVNKKTDGLIKSMYKTFKEKVCPLIEYE